MYAWMQARHPETLWRGNPSRPEIALTFDDGPHPRDTTGVLDVLARHNVRATFFLIGEQVERHARLVKQIHDGGHQIGIHCYRHKPFPLEDGNQLRVQLDRTRTVIAEACQSSASAMMDVRPPYGLFSAKMIPMFAEWKYRLVMWNCIPPHYLQPLKWTILQVLDASIPGSIIVLHDGHGHGTKAAHAVELVLPRLKSQGFEFVTVDHMQKYKGEN